LRRELVFREVWTAFAEEKDAQEVAQSFPIFLFDKRKDNPILNYDAFSTFKREGLTGTLEPSEAPDANLHDFETVCPLDPEFRS
jgi:hypothetical protein